MTGYHEMDSCYIALQYADFQPEMAQALTPCMMSWDDGCWILDLTPCLSYWRLEMTPTPLPRQPLLAHPSAEGSVQTAIIARRLLDHVYKRDYRAAISRDPWRAVLLVATMQERELTGLMDGESRLGRSVYRSMSWDVWQREVRRFLDIIAINGHTKSPLQKARTQLGQLLQMADRLALPTPSALPNVSYDSFRRRYGDILTGIWQRTFAQCEETTSNAESALFGEAFPWRGYRFVEPAYRPRHLDFPVAQWEQIVPLLSEDLFLLCSTGSLPEQSRVLLINWDIVLDDMSRMPVPILFRHPHDLHSESPHFRTALLQACYAFQGAMNRICGGEGASPPRLQAVVSWRIEITRTWQTSPQIVDIFGARNSAYDDLVELENRLAVPLLGYEQSSQWQPEDSYCEMASSPTTGAAHFTAKQPSSAKASTQRGKEIHQTGLPLTLIALARHRPLFFYRNPVAVAPDAWRGKPRFLERVMGKWWVSPKERQAPRDYYLARDEQQRLLWIYKDGFGQWYEHGLFH